MKHLGNIPTGSEPSSSLVVSQAIHSENFWHQNKSEYLVPNLSKLPTPIVDHNLKTTASALADKSIQMSEQNFIQRKCSDCKEEDDRKIHRKPLASLIQRKETTSTTHASDSVSNQIDATKGSGRHLDGNTLSFMQSRFGADFTNVKIQTGPEAVQMNRELHAKAFTVGNDIYFNEGQYSPDTTDGKKLLAHELTHTVQQGSALQRAMIQMRPADRDRIHGDILDDYADYSGMPRDRVSQHTESYASWLQMIADLRTELQTLIDGASWKEIRKRAYPKESAGGVQRAKERHAGTRRDMTGLGRLSSLDRFAAAIHTVQSNWGALKTSSRRLKEVAKATEVELKAADVHPFLVVDKEPMQSKGFFDPATWKYVVSAELVNKDVLDDADAAELANVTMHESRHAEQAFLSARFSAGVNNLSATGIVFEQNIPFKIAKDAVAKKFDATTNSRTRGLGRRMYKAIVTDRVANQAISDDVETSWDELKVKRDNAIQALDRLNQGATMAAVNNAELHRDALKAQILEVERKYSLYRRIPYEVDAHEVGDAEGQAFLGWP